MIIRATTVGGIEDVARSEGERLLREAGIQPVSSRAKAFGLDGIVTFELDESVDVSRVRRTAPLARARSLFHVSVHVARLAWDGSTLESLLAGLAGVELGEMDAAESFRVSCSRVGSHGFQSPEVERRAGAQLQERYGTAVDLERYALHVKIDIVGENASCGYQLTGRKGLDRRYPWVYHPRVTLRTPIAYAMLELAGFVRRPGALHDPFCGSGTILLEARSVLREARSEVPISGSDLKREAAEGARANLDAAAIAGVAVTAHDARELDTLVPPGSLDYIVTNPPFGIRLGRGTNFHSLYREFLLAAAKALVPRGTLCLLVGKRRGLFNRELRETRAFAIRHVRVVEMGGVYAALFVLERSTVPAG